MSDLARRDTDRLNWLITYSAYVSHSRDGEVCNVWFSQDPDDDGNGSVPVEGYPQKIYNDPREAIDSAMSAQLIDRCEELAKKLATATKALEAVQSLCQSTAVSIDGYIHQGPRRTERTRDYSMKTINVIRDGRPVTAVASGDRLGRLTYPQRCALRSLKEKAWQTAWDIQQPITTLRALEKRGLVECRVKECRTFFDNTDYEWALRPCP